MRISTLQCALILSFTVCLSGCYSGGQWSMPNLAFWKTSPFNSSAASTYPPPSVSPAKPSGLAANNSATGLTTAPSYQSTAGVAMPAGTSTSPVGAAARTAAATPQYSYPSSPTGTAAAATVPNYSAAPGYNAGGTNSVNYDAWAKTEQSRLTPAYTASSTNSVTASPYVAPQQGPYGSTATTTAANPSNPASSYTAAATNNSYPNNNVPNNSYSNPVRPPIQSNTNPAATAGDRYGSSSADRYGSSSDRYGSANDRYGSTSGSADRYAPAASAATGGVSTLPSSGTNSDNRYSDSRYSDSSPYPSNTSTGYSGSEPVNQYAPTNNQDNASRYTPNSNSSDSTYPSSSGYGSGTPYSPASTGASPSTTSPYTPPSTSAPSGSSSGAPAYRPGSVTEYTPSKSGTMSGGLINNPAASSPYGVTPANYER